MKPMHDISEAPPAPEVAHLYCMGVAGVAEARSFLAGVLWHRVCLYEKASTPATFPVR
jgi:hypothetical protein